MNAPLTIMQVADICRGLIGKADAAGVDLDDGNVVDLCADNLPGRIPLSDIRCALVVGGFSSRFPKATSHADDEGYPGIAHDFEDVRMQRDKLLDALKRVVEGEFGLGVWPSEDELRAIIADAEASR